MQNPSNLMLKVKECDHYEIIFYKNAMKVHLKLFHDQICKVSKYEWTKLL